MQTGILKMQRGKIRFIRETVLYIILSLGVLIMIFPFFWMPIFISSLKVTNSMVSTYIGIVQINKSLSINKCFEIARTYTQLGYIDVCNSRYINSK